MDDESDDSFCFPMPVAINCSESSSSDEEDSDLEVTSMFDERENELVRISDLCLNSNDTSDEDDNSVLNHSLVPYGLDSQSSEDDDISILNVSIDKRSDTTSTGDNEASGTPSQKRKRRAWSVKEKLKAINNYEKSNNKHSTAKAIGCTRFQLRQWLKTKEELKSLQSLIKGNKRKRLKGGGKKIKYVDLDERLIRWFKERRTHPTSNVTPNEIRRERISFKQLVRYGTKLSTELKHESPSIKWYRRFMLRHNLSLQRPKRNQKIPLSEAHERATSFYNYLRRASTWAPKRGDMGAFLPRDICNFDESPLSLFGDQTKRSLNYVNVDNEVENSIDSKRFATVILTVFSEGNDRFGPVLLFKGKGRVLEKEINQYSGKVKVFFTPKAVMNTETMNKFIDHWYSRVRDGHPKLLITDSYQCHLKPQTKQSLRQKSVVVAVVPKGCTQYLQILDTHVFSTFKSHYFNAAEEFLEKNDRRSRTKLTASQSRIICTHLTWEAWKRTLKSIDLKKAFSEMGYTWSDLSTVTLRTLPGYVYDPNQDLDIQIDTNDGDTENRIANDAILANQQHTQMLLKTGGKQLKLFELWNGNN